MAEFFRAPRLAELALRIDKPIAVQASDFIPIQPRGSRLPIIWIDGGPAMLPLAQALGEDQPFFGLLLDSILERTLEGMTIEKVAAEVVAAIRTAVPSRPYLIGGWCTSGILSFEVARQLRAAGEDVPLLILGHAINPMQFNAISKQQMMASKARYHAAMWWRLPVNERLRYAFARAKGVLENIGVAEPDLPDDDYHQLRTALEAAAYRYSPGAYDGDVALFQPVDRLDVLDTRPGWSARVQGRFVAHDIPGDHGTMRDQPNVATFAARLKEELERADRVSVSSALPRAVNG
jgi:thioesterase domain-containing protein